MNLVHTYLSEMRQQACAGWNRFWFTPADAATLALIRILTGAMLLYTNVVWMLELDSFFGQQSWCDRACAAITQPDRSVWSVHWILQSNGALWCAHGVVLALCAMLMVGFCTRTAAIAAWLATVSVANRVPLALFGLDQLNAMLAMYLMIGPAGAVWSIDRRLLDRQSRCGQGRVCSSVSANLAIRLIQVHLCVLYLAAGLSKLQGPSWWNGTALWQAAANLEYQSIDMTWLVHWPLLVNLATHVTVAWEVSYCVLIWPRLTRPLVLVLAIPLHLGIALCLGMTTFGLIMLVANLAFIPPSLVRNGLAAIAPRFGAGGTSGAAPIDRQFAEPARLNAGPVVPRRKRAS